MADPTLPQPLPGAPTAPVFTDDKVIDDGAFSEFSTLMSDQGAALMKVLFNLISGPGSFTNTQGQTTAVPAMQSSSVYNTPDMARNIENRTYSQPMRDRIYGSLSRRYSDAYTNYLTNVLGIKDQEQVRGTVDSVMGLQKSLASNPTFKLMGFGNIPFLKDVAADGAKDAADLYASWGYNKETDPTGEYAARFGALYDSVITGAFNTEIGNRRPSDVSKMIQYRLSQSDDYKQLMEDPNAFTRDANGAFKINPNYHEFIAQDIKKTITGAEMLARSLKMERKPLVSTVEKWSRGVLGRKMNFDSDIDDIAALSAATENAGLGKNGILPFLPKTIQSVSEAGLPNASAVRYLTRGLNMYAAAGKSGVGGTAHDDTQINNFVKMSVVAPVVGNNSQLVAAGMIMRRNNDTQGYSALKKMMSEGGDPQRMVQLMQSRNAMISPDIARRMVYSQSGESVYDDLAGSGGNAVFVDNLLQHGLRQSMSYLGSYGRFDPKRVVGWMKEKPGQVGSANPNEQMVANLSREVGSRVFENMGLSPDTANLFGSNFGKRMQSVDRIAGQNASRIMSNRYLTRTPPTTPLEAVTQNVVGGNQVTAVNGPAVNTNPYSREAQAQRDQMASQQQLASQPQTLSAYNPASIDVVDGMHKLNSLAEDVIVGLVKVASAMSKEAQVMPPPNYNRDMTPKPAPAAPITSEHVVNQAIGELKGNSAKRYNPEQSTAGEPGQQSAETMVPDFLAGGYMATRSENAGLDLVNSFRPAAAQAVSPKWMPNAFIGTAAYMAGDAVKQNTISKQRAVNSELSDHVDVGGVADLGDLTLRQSPAAALALSGAALTATGGGAIAGVPMMGAAAFLTADDIINDIRERHALYNKPVTAWDIKELQSTPRETMMKSMAESANADAETMQSRYPGVKLSTSDVNRIRMASFNARRAAYENRLREFNSRKPVTVDEYNLADDMANDRTSDTRKDWVQNADYVALQALKADPEFKESGMDVWSALRNPKFKSKFNQHRMAVMGKRQSEYDARAKGIDQTGTAAYANDIRARDRDQLQRVEAAADNYYGPEDSAVTPERINEMRAGFKAQGWDI